MHDPTKNDCNPSRGSADGAAAGDQTGVLTLGEGPGSSTGENRGNGEGKRRPAKHAKTAKGKRKPVFPNICHEKYSDDWYTPPEIPQSLGEFDLDPCAAKERPKLNHALVNWRGVDGLSQEWFGRVWLNPPYSAVGPWLDKLAKHGNGIALLNSWTEREWMQKGIRAADGAMFLRTRVRFIHPSGRRNHGCCGQVLLAFGADNLRRLAMSGLEGVVMRRAHHG